VYGLNSNILFNKFYYYYCTPFNTYANFSFFLFLNDLTYSSAFAFVINDKLLIDQLPII